jgi:dihydropteroate synthase
MSKRRLFHLQARGRILALGTVTRIMGVLNLTPDSFSDDGLLLSRKDVVSAALASARRMIKAGAEIIDVGGESTRPGAAPVSPHEEIRRVVPVIRRLVQKTDAIISVDTYKPEVALAALEAGVHMLNVIKGTPVSERLLGLCKRYGAAIVLMHMRGVPRTMQRKTHYRDVVADVVAELKKSVEKCLRFGLNEDVIVVDPGIGFAKTAEQGLEIMDRLGEFSRIGCPILVGTSRKSFIGKALGRDVQDRLMGTAATVACAVMNGAHIVRVHDVASMAQVAAMADAIRNRKIRIS